jgi:uncharacterized protein YbjT (DUF2867 family)
MDHCILAQRESLGTIEVSMKLLLVGSTGLVGRHVLELALADDRIDAVIAPVRRPLPDHPKLFAPVLDFDQLPEQAPWWHVDAVICALGTTIRVAGSQEAFRRVDHDYPLAVARLAKRYGTSAYVLNSAMGAAASSRFFYNRVKGELENDLTGLDFPSLTFVRPGLIGGHREEVRLGERVMGFVLTALGPVLPRVWRINPAERIAHAMLEAAIHRKPGVHLISSRDLT